MPARQVLKQLYTLANFVYMLSDIGFFKSIALCKLFGNPSNACKGVSSQHILYSGRTDAESK